ncbi:TonB-dependent receptor [Sphingomonas sp. DBB INV C78]|uniref:TonB-dependent receptor n=1 Tax=Sphingomonas sp. DBB INV C78 TaxID=3349434 RepID=UPI0036D25B1B
MDRVIRRGLAASALPMVLAALSGGPAFAQSAAPENETASQSGLADIVVTAQRREEKLIDTPISVTAFTSADLEAHEAVNFVDVAQYTPNFTALTTTGSNHNVGAGIRGISSQEPALAQDPRVGFYLDGVYLAKNSGAVFSIADLERIEVLRGPQGTLYGKNTTGGAINLVTAKPSGEFGFEQKFTFGNYDRFTSRTIIDLPETGGFSLKLSYLKSDRDGFFKNDNPGTQVREMDDENTDAVRVALRFQPIDWFTADYAMDWTRSKSVAKPPQISTVIPGYADVPVVTSFTPFTLAPDNPFRQLIAAGVVSPDKRLKHFSLDGVQPELVHVYGHALNLKADLGNAELRSISAWRAYRSKAEPGLNDAFDFDGGAWVEPIFHNGTVASNGIHKKQDQFSQEFQVLGTAFDERLQYTAGLYYFRETGQELSNQWNALIFLPANTIPGLNFDALYRQELILGGPPGGLGENYSIRNTSKAAYGQLTYTPPWLDGRLSFTGGLRYTKDKRKASVLDADPIWTTSKSFDNLSPSFTMAFAPNSDLNLYAKISTGYNAGSIPVRASTQAAFNTPVGDEKLTAYEIGIKSEWLDRRLRLNAAAFYYDYDDLQVSDFQEGSTILTNAGKARITGFEVEFAAVPVDGFTVTANYGYTDFKYREFIVGGVDVADIAKPPYAPKHTASGALEYVFPAFSIGELSARLDASYRSKLTFDPFQFVNTAADARTLLDARVALSNIELGRTRLEIAGWVKNLTDEEYRDFGVDFGSIGIAVNTWGDPRTFGLDLTLAF